MHRISHFPPVEEWEYANRWFVKGGKWPPQTKFCTTSSSSRQPVTRADYAPLIEHNAQNPNDLDQTYQIGNYLTTWCAHVEEVLDDLGCQSDLILVNLKLLHDEQQSDKQKKEKPKKEEKEKEKGENPRHQDFLKLWTFHKVGIPVNPKKKMLLNQVVKLDTK